MTSRAPVAIIVDGNNRLYSYYSTVPPKIVNGQRVESANGLYNFAQTTIKEMEKSFGHPVMMSFVFDSDGDTFRHEIYPKYKENRDGMDVELKSQEPIVIKLLEASGIPVVMQDHIEADDVIAVLAKEYTNAGQKVIIITTDKDLFQLVDNNVSTYNPITKKFYGPAEVLEKTGVKPIDIPLWLAIMGDKIDNIIGLPGIAEKKSATLIKNYGSIEGILAAQSTMKGVIGESVRAFGHNLELNIRLTTLVDDIEMLNQPNLLKMWGIPRQDELLNKLLKSVGLPVPAPQTIKNAVSSTPVIDKTAAKSKAQSYDETQFSLF